MGFDEEWIQARAEAAVRMRRAAAAPGTPEGGVPEAVPVTGSVTDPVADPVVRAREAALERLADFRDRVVLVPLDGQGGLWTVSVGGLDWICAFSDEATLTRFAEARGAGEESWLYRRVFGARLLDEVLPVLDFPCGVAWDAAGPDGAVFPLLRGIVPDSAVLGRVAV